MDKALLSSFITALIPLIGVIVAYLKNKQDREKKAEATNKKLDTVHVLVNGRLTDALDRVDALEKKLALPPGAPIPAAPIVTKETPPDATT